jgi:transcriptional regulator with XRE-family HTH domain
MSARRFTTRVPPSSPRPRRVVQRAAAIRRATGSDIRRLREDAGVSLGVLARTSGVSVGHLWAIEAGTADPSTEVLVAVSDALAADLSVRLFPTTGPRLRDHVQARMGEVLVRALHQRWGRFLEVPVYRPARGVIDVVVHDPMDQLLVAIELQSELRRLEQQLRWANQKRDSIPSSEMWRFLPEEPRISTALVLRNTRRNRDIVTQLAATVGVQYPGPTADAVSALTGAAPWPGASLLWVDIAATGGRLLERPPRGCRVGR